MPSLFRPRRSSVREIPDIESITYDRVFEKSMIECMCAAVWNLIRAAAVAHDSSYVRVWAVIFVLLVAYFTIYTLHTTLNRQVTFLSQSAFSSSCTLKPRAATQTPIIFQFRIRSRVCVVSHLLNLPQVFGSKMAQLPALWSLWRIYISTQLSRNVYIYIPPVFVSYYRLQPRRRRMLHYK